MPKSFHDQPIEEMAARRVTAMTTGCPCCGCGAPMEIFYELRGIPVHNALLLGSRHAALRHPRGDLALALCGECGFVTNRAFDADLVDYGAAYEETQGYSPTFTTFARQLALDWIEGYDLHGKDIIEIGCGKGEFLALLCELGANRGVGFDPAFDPARNPARNRARSATHGHTAPSPQVVFIQDYYSKAYAGTQGDFICCRHTLEHVATPRQLVDDIRQSINGRPDVAICFELPDFGRVLDEGAFWDIYYEHCSYFTVDSLAQLFRAGGFEIADLRRVYGDQYLVLEARPGDVGCGANDNAGRMCASHEMGARVRAFAETCGRRLGEWRRDLAAWSAAGRRVVLWGSGSKAVGFVTTLGVTDEIECVVDINPHRWGRYMPCCPQAIVAPETLRQIRPDVVIMMNPIYREEIRAELSRLEIEADLVGV